MSLRETLIALRARRTAYRIAVDLLFPHFYLAGQQPIPDWSAQDQFDRQCILRRREKKEWEEIRYWFRITVAVAAVVATVVALMVALG